MKISRLIAAAGGLVVLASASAQAQHLAFSFADPVPGRQLTHTALGNGTGTLTYDTGVSLNLLIDATSLGFGSISLPDVRLQFNMTLGTATTAGGVTLAPVAGDFLFYTLDDSNQPVPVLQGASQAGAFVRIGSTNSLLFSSDDGFVYTPGAMINAMLGSTRELAPLQEAVFTLTDVNTNGAGAMIGPGGVFRSFTANSSFSGNSEVRQIIPTPGATALMLLGGAMAARRRRK